MYFQIIHNEIRKLISNGFSKFAIYPLGEQGCQVKCILKEQFGISDVICVDNFLSRYNSDIFSSDIFKDFNTDRYQKYIIIFACANEKIHDELKFTMKNISKERIIDIFPAMNMKPSTRIGKYSYGSLCKPDWLIESIGSFCSFAENVSVVANHPISYISTHPMLYYGIIPGDIRYSEQKEQRWYFDGVEPKGDGYKLRKITIGNDVWLGKNVVITNGANIGNGVIAGAGAVITKDVPDYAIVAGVPAKIIRYRYTPEQIQALNCIKWWDWSDEKIRKNFDDFYMEIDAFISKHLKGDGDE